MWNTDEKVRNRKMALAAGGYVEPARKKQNGRKLSSVMAMLIGVLVTLEIMVAGAMMLNLDFRGTDIIAMVFVFVVLYFGVVAILTDK